jgi:hypothetical protein
MCLCVYALRFLLVRDALFDEEEDSDGKGEL